MTITPRAPTARLDPPGPILLVLALELVYLGATRTRGAWLGASRGHRRSSTRSPGARFRGAALGVVLALGVAALAAAVIPGRVVPRDVADAKRFEPGEHVVREALDPRSPVLRERLGLWRRTLAMYRAHPLLGVGPGNFQVFFPAYAEPGARADGVMSAKIVPRRAHEDLLERLAETGPLGLAALLAVYAVGLWPSRCGGRGWPAADPARARVPGRRSDGRGGGRRLPGGAVRLRTHRLPAGDAGDRAAVRDRARFSGLRGHACPRAPARARSGGRRPASAGRDPGLAVAIVAATAIGSVRGLTRSYWLARERAALRPAALDLNAALRALRAAERASPGTFEVALETAYVLERLHRFGDALAATDRALAIEPYAIPTWLVRARSGAGQRRRAGRARQRRPRVAAVCRLSRRAGHSLAASRRRGSAHADAARAAKTRERLQDRWLRPAGESATRAPPCSTRSRAAAGSWASAATTCVRRGSEMKVALVHDWLVSIRGAEKVLESFCRLYPEADLFTLRYDAAGRARVGGAGGPGGAHLVHRSACRARSPRGASASACCCRCSRWRSSRSASTATTW